MRELKKRNRLLEGEVEILRRAPAYFEGYLPKMSYPLVVELAADGIAVTLIC